MMRDERYRNRAYNRCRRLSTPGGVFRREQSRAVVALLFLIVWCAGIIAPLAVEAEPLQEREGRIKAAFLYYAAKFIDWGEHLDQGTTNLTLCLVAPEEFVEIAKETFAEKTVQGYGVEVLVLGNRLDEEGGEKCQMLFLSREATLLDHSTEELPAVVTDSSAFTVSDLDGFIKLGGMLEISKRNNRIEFFVHRGRAQKAGYQLSAEMLQFARRVIHE